MTPEENIKHYLVSILRGHVGHDKRIGREELKAAVIQRVGFPIGDRKMRTLIEELRNESRGAWICGSLAGGYFTAKDADELEEHLRSDENRAMALLARIRKQRLGAGQQNPSQTRLPL